MSEQEERVYDAAIQVAGVVIAAFLHKLECYKLSIAVALFTFGYFLATMVRTFKRNR